MSKLDHLNSIVNDEGITCIENARLPSRFKGIYSSYNEDRMILLGHAIQSCAEKTCILAEELGHHFTSYGDILDQTKHENEKQELRARAWATEKLLPLDRVVAAFEHGCRNLFEIADFLDLTEEFITESVEYYKRKYGIFTVVNSGHIIYFEPFGVMKPLHNSL